MSDNIKWGPAIAVDGKRPGWLGEFADRIAYQRNGNRWFGLNPQWPDMWSESDIVDSGSGWGNVTAIRLPADHPHYRQTEAAIPEGMKPWHGGDAAPADWPRFGRVQFRNGEFSQGSTEYNWKHLSNDYDIVAYTPQPTPQADTKPDLTAEQRAVEFVRFVARQDVDSLPERSITRLWSYDARAIVALLPEPVDPDLIEAREIAAAYLNAPVSDVRDGGYDSSPEVGCALMGLKRRELAHAGETGK